MKYDLLLAGARDKQKSASSVSPIDFDRRKIQNQRRRRDLFSPGIRPVSVLSSRVIIKNYVKIEFIIMFYNKKRQINNIRSEKASRIAEKKRLATAAARWCRRAADGGRR